MDYGVSSSGANTKQRVPPTLTALGYNCGSNTNWTFDALPDFMADYEARDAKFALISNHYKSGNTSPVLIRGNTLQGAGHAWIIDGYLHTTMKIRTHRLYPEQRYYYYCNWGWNGTANGWYIQDSFMTTRGPNKGESDESLSTTRHEFTINREFIVGIQKN